MVDVLVVLGVTSAEEVVVLVVVLVVGLVVGDTTGVEDVEGVSVVLGD